MKNSLFPTPTAEKIQYLLRKGENRTMNVTTASGQPDPSGRVGLAMGIRVRVVGGGISGGAATVAGVRHQNALNRYTLHTTQLQDAISADHTVSDQLPNAYAAAQDIQKLTPLTDQLAGLVEQG